MVIQVLGHSQISITLNTYTHVSAGLSRVAADRLQLLLGVASEVVAAGLAARKQSIQRARASTTRAKVPVTRAFGGAALGI